MGTQRDNVLASKLHNIGALSVIGSASPKHQNYLAIMVTSEFLFPDHVSQATKLMKLILLLMTCALLSAGSFHFCCAGQRHLHVSCTYRHPH